MFLEYFGLRGLEELPNATELQQIPISKPEAPVTTGDSTTDEEPEQMTLDEVEEELAEDDDDADEMEAEEARQTS